ncbi:MAG: hypothetical protein KC731_34560, partial [Myxococcales bacterium]|nr:hypothetical protein [Myxococcales bacterium]
HRCGLPFPSDVWTRSAEDTPTGKRVHFGAATLPSHESSGAHLSAEAFTQFDGFSVGQAPMTYLEGATVTGLPSLTDIDASLLASSPTVLLNTVTGEAVPHFAELDLTSDDPAEQVLMLRPVVRLDDATRYIVAIRGVVDGGGATIEPTEVFRALRDGTESDDPTVAARRDHYDDIFGRLADAGYDKADLQVAWDFTTSSLEGKTGWMLHMRDEALATVGAAGPSYVIDEVVDAPNQYIARRILGRMTVPLYMESVDPGAKLVLGADGMPMQNGTGEFAFMVQIPNSATTGTPGFPLQNGHGLLGSLDEGRNSWLAQLADEKNYVLITVNFVGFAEDDESVVLSAIIEDFTRFGDIIQRQHQGMINSLLAMRMVRGDFANDDAVKFNGVSAIDTSAGFYRGDSQGGIYGHTYMALTTDVERGLLGEPGGPYNLLLNRSVDFSPFFAILNTQFPDHIDTQIVLGLAQMFWDRTDPITYCNHINDNLLPNTPHHEVLSHVAIGDYQVSPHGAHILARGVNAKSVTPAYRPIWGIEEASQPFTGSGIVEFQFPGVPEVPLTNVPPQDLGMDPHDEVRKLQVSRDQTDQFLRTGVIEHLCSGICDPE